MLVTAQAVEYSRPGFEEFPSGESCYDIRNVSPENPNIEVTM